MCQGAIIAAVVVLLHTGCGGSSDSGGSPSSPGPAQTSAPATLTSELWRGHDCYTVPNSAGCVKLQPGPDGKYPGEIPKCSIGSDCQQLEYGIGLTVRHSRVAGRTLSFRFSYSWASSDFTGETEESKLLDSYYRVSTMFWLPSADGIRIWRDYTVFLEVRETGAGLPEPNVMKREFVISFPTPNWTGTFVGRITSGDWLEGQPVTLQLSQSGDVLTGVYRIEGTSWAGNFSDTIYTQHVDRTGRFTISDSSRSPSVCTRTLVMNSAVDWSCASHSAYFGTIYPLKPCPGMPEYGTLAIQYCR